MNQAYLNAARYADEMGWLVFPIQEGGKKPLTRNGFKDATNSPEQIAQWNQKFPKANWALATGSESGVYVVDLDSEDADSFYESLWLAEGQLVSTPRGGKHWYYSYDGSNVDLGITNGSIHAGMDTRGNGGYVLLPGSKTSSKIDPKYADGEYVGELTRDMPEVPEGLIELIPEKQSYETLTEDAFAALQEAEKPSSKSEPEKRVLKGLTDLLDGLERPWREGAGWHSTGFFVACALHRVSNSPDYSTTEAEAYSLYMSHVPHRPEDEADIWDVRWNSAKKQTVGQVAEAPGDVPIRLNALETLDKYRSSQIDELFWNSTKVGQVKSLIHEMRLAGATEQEAYSVSYESAAMSAIRKSNQGSSSTWGYVLNEYSMPLTDDDGDAPDPIKAVAKAGEGAKTPITLLSAEERAIVRDYPNFIDSYIDAARAIYEEPNMPIHYVNSWGALSASMGDRARLYFETGETPLNLWTMKMAPSAAGKSDANKYHDDVVDACSARGFRDIDLGSDASAEALTDVLMDRDRKSSMMFMDEAHKFLNESKATGSYQYKVRQAFLELYDGRVSQSIRKGMDKASVGDRVWSNFILSLQGTWAKMTEAMEEGDIESGFVGRFLVAVGDGPKITRKSLTLKFAPEYQVETNSGRHPLVDAFCAPVRQVADGIAPGALVAPASDAVIERLADMRLEMDAYAKKHPLGDHLLGVFLRIGVNIFKGAALLAISEGRTKVEMTDLLLAAKSGEHWIKSSIALAEAISTSEYRRLVEYVVEQVCIRPRSRANLLSMARLKNLRMFEASEVIDRAEREGKIRFDTNKQKFYEKED